MKHKVGDKVRIKSREWYEENKNESGDIDTIPVIFTECMAKYCGKTATIVEVDDTDGTCRVDIDDRCCWWSDDMFEGVVEDVAEDTNETENTEPTSFRRLTNELADTLERKNHDYGNSFADLFKKYGLVYPIIHLAEKLGRIETLAKQPNKVDGESIKDSLKDLAGYCILTLKEME